MTEPTSGTVTSGLAEIFFEVAGDGPLMVMIHAGVADHRQWDAAFNHFQHTHRVLRYDMRGFGRSRPADESYRPIDDLEAVLRANHFDAPTIMMGCSMGGTLAMDYTIAHPGAVAALIMVCSGPSGLRLDVEAPAKFAEVEKAEQENDLDLVCELETQIWFDGSDRRPEDVDPQARALLYDMNRIALEHDAAGLGQQQYDLTPAAYKRMDEIDVPVLIVTGAHDVPFMAAAASRMRDAITHTESYEFPDAAHLPNMEHPERFNTVVQEFLARTQGDGS